MRPPALALFAVLLVGPVAFAQSDRYELGARMKAFEAEWDRQTDKDARKRALGVVGDVTTQFLTFQLGAAGKTLDDARYALLSDKPQPDTVLWATSLYPEVKTRLTAEKEVPVTVKQFYTVKAERPKGLSVRCGFDGKAWTTADLDKLPAKLTVPIPKSDEEARDLTLTMEVVQDGKTLATRTVGVSVFNQETLDVLDRLQKQWGKSEDRSMEMETHKAWLAQIRDLANGTIPELDIPAASLGKLFAENVLVAENKRFKFGPKTPGDLRVSIPTGDKEKTVTPCRLFVPKGLDPKKPVPLVVAMHGMGGSENLFFDGYGAGHIKKLCEKRGWLCVCPRAGLGFGLSPAPPYGEIVDELAKRYPVDAKRVFVVGHSMGSGMAVDAAQKYPGKFAALACLAGGGKVRDEKAVADLPVFVGVGDKDFALKTAQGLRTTLEKAKAKVTYKEYPDVEHMVIVREALGDVFDGWDKMK